MIKPSGENLVLQLLWVTPSSDDLSQIGQRCGKKSLLEAIHKAQNQVPDLPQPTHFLGKIKSRIDTN